jgi:uncharacterized protein YceK
VRKTLAILLLALAGCGTVYDAIGADWAYVGPPSPHVFGGVRGDWFMVNGGDRHLGFLGLFCLFDLPLSAAADVVLLPITVPVSLFAPEQKP